MNTPTFKKSEIVRSARVKEDLWFQKHEAELIKIAQERLAREAKAKVKDEEKP